MLIAGLVFAGCFLRWLLLPSLDPSKRGGCGVPGRDSVFQVGGQQKGMDMGQGERPRGTVGESFRVPTRRQSSGTGDVGGEASAKRLQ